MNQTSTHPSDAQAHPRRRWLLIVAVAFGILALAAYVSMSGRSLREPFATRADREATHIAAAASTQAATAYAVVEQGTTSPLGATPTYVSATSWQSEFGCLEAQCAPAWNLAQSAEEAAWLHRNGYGGRSERVALAALSDSALRARFYAGDLVAGTIYHDRLVSKRDPAQWDFVLQLAARGSVLALYKMAGHYYARGPHANKYFFAAALRLAQMRGDRWAINELKAWQPTMRYDLVDTIVDEKVSILLSNIEQARLEHGYPPLTIDIRPAAPEVDQTAIAPPRG